MDPTNRKLIAEGEAAWGEGEGPGVRGGTRRVRRPEGAREASRARGRMGRFRADKLGRTRSSEKRRKDAQDGLRGPKKLGGTE